MKIYVAGPYTKGDVAVNVRKAILAADKIRGMGHTPFVPHLTHFWHLVKPHEIEFWYQYDFEWLLECDAILRLPGASRGADHEIAVAKSRGIFIFHSLREIEKYKEKRTK